MDVNLLLDLSDDHLPLHQVNQRQLSISMSAIAEAGGSGRNAPLNLCLTKAAIVCKITT
jgi:hypothetical protein